MTPGEALEAARLALPYVQAGSYNMGKAHGNRNAARVLGEAFAAIDTAAAGGELPAEWWERAVIRHDADRREHGWTCGVCGQLNPEDSRRCGACWTNRP